MTVETIRAERLQLVHRLRDLPDGDWDRPSLCAGWTVRHVLAHLTTPFAVSVPAMGLRFVRHRGIGRAMHAVACDLAERHAPDELLDLLERNAGSTFRPPGMPLATPLTDAVVHSVDVRWALGDDRGDTGDPSRLRPALDFVVSPWAALGFVPPGRLRGLALEAEDAGWRHGAGADVHGPALSLLVAVLGRRTALQDLRGDGVALLDRRTQASASATS